ncbi:MAG TPA: hypothetical protein VMR76_03205 [Candidatus Saccharimonadia bacterium]|nr:hypothetical protein [Candidatus Saccharimonadia bacterium]
MYSGFTLTKYSGRLIGAHQKIDTLARKQLGFLLGDNELFPSYKNLLKFEGKNGPDGLKRKSTGKNEPEHYYDPFGSDDTLPKIISEHYKNLVKELKAKNSERSAFEAAWLAHCIVDGLTPAHHYPYKQKLFELLKNGSKRKQSSLKEKMIMPGKTKGEFIKNNWKFWGPKGLMLTHGLFELGAAVVFVPLNVTEKTVVDSNEIKKIRGIGYMEYFKNISKEIAVLDIYGIYYKRGWTPKLARMVKSKLAPAMINTVTLVWYSALIDANIVKFK